MKKGGEAMRILHTSDWHLGKTLEGRSRLAEQKLFIEELIKIVEQKQIDMILLAGDIYDSSNPPATAEALFYSAMVRLSKDGRRPIVVIAGNHDSAARLMASYPLAVRKGILLFGTPKTVATVGNYGHFSILESGEGYFEIELRGEKAVILTMPYPSEKRLNEIIGLELDEEKMQKSYSEKIGQLFSKNQKKFRKDTINLAMGHFFVLGGKESGSERPIQLGGSLGVHACHLPDQAQYIALGHLHRPQTVSGTEKKAFYSGSPLPYNKDEILYSKQVQVVELKPEKKADIEQIFLTNHKPIEQWEAENIEQAIALCKERSGQNSWVYLKIRTDRILESQEIREMRMAKADIIEIEAVFKNQEEENQQVQTLEEQDIQEQFCSFYLQKRHVKPGEETVDQFLKILNEEVEDEADSIEDQGNQQLFGGTDN